MAHYAQIEDGVVVSVIVAEQDFIDTQSGTWVQTSYNTYGGVHSDGGTSLRKNYAGVGYTYNDVLDTFYAPQPFPSWNLNETSCLWEPPIAMPDDGQGYTWNETTTSWDVYNG